MARRRAGVTRATRKKGALIWTTVLGNNILVDNGARTEADIVTSSDWTVVGGSEKATLMRIRGWLGVSLTPAGALTSGAPVFSYIATFDEDELGPGAATATTYSEEDILATYGHEFPYTNLAEGRGPTWQQIIDVKAMRKIRTGMDVRLVLSNLTSLDVVVSFVIRGLIKRS